jgi:hypothetical protein
VFGAILAHDDPIGINRKAQVMKDLEGLSLISGGCPLAAVGGLVDVAVTPAMQFNPRYGLYSTQGRR